MPPRLLEMIVSQNRINFTESQNICPQNACLLFSCCVKLSLRDLSSNLMTILPDRIFDTTSNLRQL